MFYSNTTARDNLIYLYQTQLLILQYKCLHLLYFMHFETNRASTCDEKRANVCILYRFIAATVKLPREWRVECHSFNSRYTQALTHHMRRWAILFHSLLSSFFFFII